MRTTLSRLAAAMLVAAFATAQDATRPAQQTRPAERPHARLLELIDADHDGDVTDAEVDAFRAHVAKVVAEERLRRKARMEERQERREELRDDRHERQQDRVETRQDRRDDRVERREDRRDDRVEDRQERREDRREDRKERQQQRVERPKVRPAGGGQ